MRLIDELCCQSFCQHGGICAQKPGHPPPHRSGYCSWTDAEALTRAEADAVICALHGAQALGELERAEELLEAWYLKQKKASE